MVLSKAEQVSRIALSSIHGIGPKRFSILLERFKSAQRVFEAPYASFKNIPRFSRNLYFDIQNLDRNYYEKLLISWKNDEIHTIFRGTKNYPSSLEKLHNPPALLFSNVSWRQPSLPIIAIVGSRKPARSSLIFAESLAYNLAESAIIISGLAQGTDTSSHIGVLKAGGLTIAVVGNGILIPFPPENRELHQNILTKGVIISEQMPHINPSSGTLIARNRIIAALADMTIVIEAQRQGGSIETGMKSLKLEKPLFVYDIPVNGNRFLIRHGGISIRSVNEVFSFMES